MLNVPDRTAVLFGDQAIRDEFEQALKAAGRFHQNQRIYLDDGPFSGAVQVVGQALEDLDLHDVADEDRSMVAGVRTLARQIKFTGYAMAYARTASDPARNDWPELLAFVRQQFTSWAEQEDHDGPARCAHRIVDPCEQILSAAGPAEDRGDAYAALRHLATLFAGASGFHQEWALRVG
ncbi:hypothetical protein ACWEQP_05900 [Streptomyces sp. NPDC004044]